MPVTTGELAGPFMAFARATAVAAVLWPAAGAAIPPGRLADWSRAGTEDGIQKTKVAVNFSAYAPAGTGEVDDYEKLEKAIADCQSPGTVLLPAGTYLLKSPIRMRNGVVLRGEGQEKTNLVFDLPPRTPEAVLFEGVMDGSWELLQPASTGTARIVLKSSEGLLAGEDIVLFPGREEPATAKGRNRAGGQAGQVLRIREVVKRALLLDVPLKLDYPLADLTKVRRLKTVAWAGLEDLSLTRRDTNDGALVRLRYARDCWISGCGFANVARANVDIETSRYITVRDSFFHHASNRADSVHGCGVVAGRWTADTLVTNNVFWNLRHAMVVRDGASGNVFSHNFSCEAVDERGRPSVDIVVAGRATCANLFEGNTARLASLGETGNPPGPRNTLFRNRVCGLPLGRERAAIVVSGGACAVNIAGNTLASGRVSAAKADGALVEANRTGTGKVEAVAALPASLYLKAAPDFWGNRPWPALGADKDTGAARDWTPIPAQERFELLTGVPPCPCAAARAAKADETEIIE